MSINRLSHFLNLEELNPNNVEKTMPEHSEFLSDWILVRYHRGAGMIQWWEHSSPSNVEVVVDFHQPHCDGFFAASLVFPLPQKPVISSGNSAQKDNNFSLLKHKLGRYTRGILAKWLGCQTWNPVVVGPSFILTTSWSCFAVDPSSTPRPCL